jgi:hypothetical protein
VWGEVGRHADTQDHRNHRARDKHSRTRTRNVSRTVEQLVEPPASTAPLVQSDGASLSQHSVSGPRVMRQDMLEAGGVTR